MISKSSNKLTVLVVPDDLTGLGVHRRHNHLPRSPKHTPIYTTSVDDAVDRLKTANYDLIVLDHTRIDADVFTAFTRLAEKAPDTPIVVLSQFEDDALGFRLIRAGAQDVIIEWQSTEPSILRALTYASERHRQTALLKNLSEIDALTGLYNRRGFFTVADRVLKIARRNRKSVLLVHADYDNLKAINDRHGHLEGDNALMHTADVLKHTFRDADILARISGDEFAALVVESERGMDDSLLDRLQRNLRTHNRQNGKSGYGLSVTTGVARFDPLTTVSLEHLIAEAASAHIAAEERGPQT